MGQWILQILEGKVSFNRAFMISCVTVIVLFGLKTIADRNDK
jgi:hypothetical protein